MVSHEPGRVFTQPTITNEALLARHYEVDGCCGYCSPCLALTDDNINEVEGPCQGWPCPTVKALSAPARTPSPTSHDTP